jgi:ATP-dependent helicase/nuclease subunit A
VSTRRIPADVLDVQRAASDPTVSAWVSANAGSGKTHVLAQRVIRLLLSGTKPEKILCLTYTKAAAANMANRVFETLGKWTAFDDAKLDAEITGIEGRRPDAKRRIRARRLFAEALDTPGGLKVQTIHAFCTRLLHQFPFEADVAARFEVLEDRTRSELIDRQRMAVLLEASAKPDSPLGRALGVAITIAADQTFADVVGDVIARQDELTKWIAAAGGIEAAMVDLSRALGIEPDDTAQRVEAEIVDGPLLPQIEWPTVAALCRASSANDQKQCERLSRAAAASGTGKTEEYLSVFLTDKSEKRKSIVTSGFGKQYPELAQRLIQEQERISGLIARRRAAATRERTAALMTVAAEVIARYRAEKDRRGLLDYDDLIDKTFHLLGNERAAWVHYRLDMGIDHVLIDEAQDTSAPQWEIVSRLVAEFAAGKGAREVTRSIFAVGDEKQSIFSFQGAEPKQFADMQRKFASAHAASGLEFRRREFKHSFRSGANILGAVDSVFSAAEIFRSVTTDEGGIPPHIAVREKAPGAVELWPLIEPDEKREIEGWDAPFDETTETSPRVRLARRIARSVKAWIARRDPVGEGNERHAVRPGDILVLVRQRGALFEAVIRALKEAGVPVAGADRLVLTEHIAVMDLIALADALLLPDDDLALASVLKSPLFGISEEQLFTLAWNRESSLRAALRMKAQEDAAFAGAHARLERYADWARHLSPFSFYARVLGAERGRARFLARLGAEAIDALDEFLEHTLIYERHEAPTLQGFVAWLRGGDTMVKRDMDIARDEVRVMTVHGAKGLEAPIVILADTTTPPKGPKEPRIFALPANAAPGAPDRLVWASRKVDDVEPVAAARASAVQDAVNEYRRLLYVAMTRAADRLVVAGARGAMKMPEGCWYQLVENTLKVDAVEEPADDGEGSVWRWRKSAPEQADAGEVVARVAEAQRHDVPVWLRRDAPIEHAAPRAIAPSLAGDGARVLADAHALARGRAVHRLLQVLPSMAPEQRAEAAGRYLDRKAQSAEFDEAERRTIAGEVLALLAAPRFAALFGAGSRAEVPIVGKTSLGRVSGQVDRLVVTDTEVLIADYKSDRSFTRSIARIPQAYVEQLALYREVLRLAYPNHHVRTALVWTAAPALAELPDDTLDAALSRRKDA